ncbi:hypothetical protein M422DRAFT_241609 [Sphaerobolus stellatus SS14]|nr:hypothetical protein M422DRAFT_241609 [Sphaerobolus stellatus SS14]
MKSREQPILRRPLPARPAVGRTSPVRCALARFSRSDSVSHQATSSRWLAGLPPPSLYLRTIPSAGENPHRPPLRVRRQRPHPRQPPQLQALAPDTPVMSATYADSPAQYRTPRPARQQGYPSQVTWSPGLAGLPRLQSHLHPSLRGLRAKPFHEVISASFRLAMRVTIVSSCSAGC